MNKKIITVVITIAISFTAGGILYWQNNNQNRLKTNITKVDKNLIEVFYLPHPPVVPIRQKIKAIGQKFPDYTLKEYSFDDSRSQQKIKDYNLTGHIPIAIFINGKNLFTINGSKIILKNFPQSDPFVPTLSGSWDYDDLEKILTIEDQNK